MAKQSIEDYKNKLQDKLSSLTRKRNELILEVNNLQKEMSDIAEQVLALDESKIKILCMPQPLGCGGKGYVEDEQGNKKFCPVCNNSKYIWATKYEEETESE